MRTDEFDYHLPPELIAQSPLERGQSRLLVIHRNTDRIEHAQFADLPSFLAPPDLLVLNDTRVTARRIRAVRENGSEAEVLVLRPVGDRCVDALVRPGRAFRRGRSVTLIGAGGARMAAEVVGDSAEGGRTLSLPDPQSRDNLLQWGEAPLPPYIHTALPRAQEDRYQTVYATADGSAAAPTAGLHFTPQLLAELTARGVRTATVTLHVGVGTFRPVRAERLEDHEMHAETAVLPPETAGAINSASGRVVAVGTTSVRTLETAAAGVVASGEDAARVAPFAGETRLFITPGYRFRAVDALITNFHLPRSTLLMLVSAFAGVDLVRRAYQEAVENRYRFFSFGDAMLIL